MFLELPVLIVDEEGEEERQILVDVNPFQIIAIEPYVENKRHSIVILHGIEYEVLMTRKALKKLVSDFMKENVLSKIYKDIKDQSN